jgi:excisionase family DNA binding protein
MTDRLLVSPREAAALLGIGHSKLYLLLQNGELDSLKIGSCRRIPMASIEALVKRLSQADTERAAG